MTFLLWLHITTWRAGLSGFCNFGLVSFMGFVIEPWHSRYVLFLCECAASSVLEPCPLSRLSVLFRLEYGVQIPALMSWVSIRVFGHSCSMFLSCIVKHAVSSSLGCAISCPRQGRSLEGGHGVATGPHKMCLPPPPQGGAPRGTRFFTDWELRTSIFLGQVHNRTTYSLRTNNTVIDTCVVLSPYFCVNGELEAVFINRSQAVFRQRFGTICSSTVSNSVWRV